MRKYTCVSTLLAMAALVLPSIAFAADIHRVRGKMVSVEFYSVDPTGCIGTSLYVVAAENRVQEQGPPVVEGDVGLYYSQYDNCTFQIVTCGTAETTLPEGVLSLSRNLDSATLSLPLQIEHCLTGEEQAATISLDLTGTGDLGRSHTRSTYSFPGYRSSQRTSGESRTASGTATLTIGGTTTTFQDGVGDLSLVSNGTLSISR